jgi:hypothetical protein
MPRNNKEIVKEINVPSDPQEGTRMPAGKADTETDALGKPGSYKPQAVTQAKEETGVAKRCLDAQLGRGDKSMSKTGGKLGDATNHPQAGGTVDDGHDGDRE